MQEIKHLGLERITIADAMMVLEDVRNSSGMIGVLSHVEQKEKGNPLIVIPLDGFKKILSKD